jgi:hypothetical protein
MLPRHTDRTSSVSISLEKRRILSRRRVAAAWRPKAQCFEKLLRIGRFALLCSLQA